MPKQIGKLNNLQTLSHFVVGEENGSNIQELGNLNRLQGKLCISGLVHVINPEDAAGANLKDKKHVEELNMDYGYNYKSSNNGRESNVLEALQANSNLKRLTISQYKCNSFPNWIRGSHLPNLVSLQLKGCRLCSHLPPLGQFPCLKELSIRDFDGIKIIGEEFHGNSSTNVPFLSLEVLEFAWMDNWEEWFCLEGFPLLKELSIRYCPKLKRALLPQHLPSLQILKIHDCNELEEWLCLKGFPLLKKLSIKRCPELKRALLPQHLPSLQKLKINDCNKLEASIPKCDSIIELDLQRCERILVNELPTSLKKFVLRENQYTEFSVEQILVNNTILEKLELDLSGSLKCPSLDLCCYNSLCGLLIKGWGSSSSFSLHLFTNLDFLELYDCPELESFPEGGLPSNLGSLNISNCPKLIGSREEWGLFQLNSLKRFSVSDEFENVESFPEENLLPPTLKSLHLNNCSKLRKMNNKGFLHLKSLKYLNIENCPSLERLPEKEALPNSLYTLWIEDCPLIKEKYQREGGEHWHTISHFPSVYIDRKRQKQPDVAAGKYNP